MFYGLEGNLVPALPAAAAYGPYPQVLNEFLWKLGVQVDQVTEHVTVTDVITNKVQVAVIIIQKP